MHWTRDEYLDHLCFAGSPREMVVELFGLLIGTAEVWQRQGATPAEIDLTAFAWDRVDLQAVPFDREPRTGMVEEVLRDTPTERVVRDRLGRTTILPKQFATLSLPRDFPLRQPGDWERIRPWFAFHEDRVDPARLAACRASQARGVVTRANIWGAYDVLRQLMGDETACLAVLDWPELVADILQTVGDMQCAGLERCGRLTPIDILFVHEDFAGKSGPLVGPEVVRELFVPYYRRHWEIVRRAGARIFDLDSDGDVTPVLDALLEGGVNCLHPVQPTGRMDLVALRQRYGRRLILRGGIDKHALEGGPSAIDAELDRRLHPCLLGGGTMFGLDHRVPGGVDLESYRYYVRRLRERLGRRPAAEDEPGWCRMA